MAWTHCVQGLIMSWEKYKGLIVKMLHFCSLQLTIQSNSNLRIFFFFFFKEQCVQFGVRWLFLLPWLQLLGDSLEMLPFRSPLRRLPASRRWLPGPQCRCQQAGNSPRNPGLVYIPARQGDTKRPNYLWSDLFLCFLCLFLPKLSTHRERVVKHLGPVTHPALQSQGWSRWSSQ